MRFGGGEAETQIVAAEPGLLPELGHSLPITERARDVAAGAARPYFEDSTIDDVHVRMPTQQVGPGFAMRLARSLDETDDTLARLRRILFAVGLVGVGVAVALGLVVAARAAPVRRRPKERGT